MPAVPQKVQPEFQAPSCTLAFKETVLCDAFVSWHISGAVCLGRNSRMALVARLDCVRLASSGYAVGHDHAALQRARQLAHHRRRSGLVECRLLRVAAEHAREVIRLAPVSVLVPGRTQDSSGCSTV